MQNRLNARAVAVIWVLITASVVALAFAVPSTRESDLTATRLGSLVLAAVATALAFKLRTVLGWGMALVAIVWFIGPELVSDRGMVPFLALGVGSVVVTTVIRQRLGRQKDRPQSDAPAGTPPRDPPKASGW